MARPSDRHRGSGDRRRSGGGRGQDGRRKPAPQKDSRPGRPQRGRITAVPSGQLPRWVRDEIIRSTGKEKRETFLVPLRKIGDLTLVKTFLY